MNKKPSTEECVALIERSALMAHSYMQAVQRYLRLLQEQDLADDDCARINMVQNLMHDGTIVTASVFKSFWADPHR